MDAEKAMKAFDQFRQYAEDFGRLSGGQMKAKYGDDPMGGYDNVLRRMKQAHATLQKALHPDVAVSNAA